MTVLAHGLADMGIFPVSADEALDKESGVYRRWTLHGTGHMLGLDVHDCSAARSENYLDGKLEPGMVLTVEPRTLLPGQRPPRPGVAARHRDPDRG